MVINQWLQSLIDRLPANPELQSAAVRLGVWTFGTCYITLGALTHYYKVDVPYFVTLFIIFALIYLALFASVLIHPDWPARRFVTLSIDIVAISLAIFITREAISPFYLLYIWIFISAGTRYGTPHLVLASAEAVIAYSLVLTALGQWQRHTYEAVFFLFFLLLLPLYQYSLLRRVQYAKDEAERANKAKGDFLAFMTHELRTPLTGVIGMTELLKTTPLDAEQRDYVVSVSNAANVLSALIGDILDFSKIDATKLKLEQAPFDPRRLVREVCGVLGGQALTAGLELICEVTPAVPATIVGDALRVRQILFNLAGNAVKFTEAGEVRVRLSVCPAQDGIDRPHLLLEVRDTGIGIPADKLDSIFESFRQADDSTTRRFGGSGLGTTIALELSRLMSGTIGVDSVEGQGSRFWVRLPLLGDELPMAPAPAGRLAGRRGLLIESNATQRDLACATLRREGADCRAVSNPAEIPPQGPEPRPPDFVVIGDHPRGRALEATRAEVDAILGTDPPCLYLTYATRRPEPQRTAACCLTKPFLDEELVGAVAGLLGPGPMATGCEPVQPGFGGVQRADLTGVRVLIAEDNAIAAKVITAFLTKMGVDYTLVGDGEEALREAVHGDYGIAIVDLRMPRLDGIQFVRTYRGRTLKRPLPVVVLTANASEDVKKACLDAGMADFLAKPVSPEALRMTIERLAIRPEVNS